MRLIAKLLIFAWVAAISIFAISHPTLAATSISGCDNQNCLDSPSANPNRPDAKPLNIPTVTFNNVARRSLGVLLAAAGVLSTIFLVLGGIKYTSSNGDPAKVAGAKNTITYAIIGLIISITAGLIVGFVLGNTPG